MSKRGKLRLVSLLMLIVAVIFVICAMCCPTCGRVFYIGSFKVTGEVLRTFYKGYVAVMCALFVASFFVGKKKS